MSIFSSPKPPPPPPLPALPPPPPTPLDPNIARTRSAIRRRASAAGGRGSTIKSPGGAQGLVSATGSRKKTLLGGP